MLRTYYLQVLDAERAIHRLEESFATDAEAIQHSQELAAMLRRRHFPIKPGLMIAVLDHSRRKLHEEFVYPEAESRA